MVRTPVPKTGWRESVRVQLLHLPLWKIDLAVGWRPDKRIQMKLQYSYVEQSGSFQQGQNLLAAQFTIKF